MQKWNDDFTAFCRNKIYISLLTLTAVLGYGFLVTHQTIGIDDTPYSYYFEEGLNVIVGRWFLYVLNKVFSVAEFSPFITDLAGVLILMLAVTMWVTLFYSIFKDIIPKWGYYFFACVFLSCPLISEVYTYYLHNGISVGYLCCGISLCFFKEFTEGINAVDKGKKYGFGKREILTAFGTAGFLFVALGCYESFMIVWLVGLIFVLLSQRCMGVKSKVLTLLVCGAFMAAVAIVLRSIMIKLCTAVFGLEQMRDEAVQRSITEMLGWMFEKDAGANFAMAMKRTFVMYFAFAHAYYPIFIFVVAVLLLLVTGIWLTVRRRDLWILLLSVGSIFAAFLLLVIEGKVTLYRSAQFLPLVCAFGVLLVAYGVSKVKHRAVSGVAIFLLSAVLWNQCFDMNHWFYVDWLKYESAKETMIQVAAELQKHYDTSKPIVFTGAYQVPKSIIESAYVQYGTETYFDIKAWTDLLDKDLLDKFNRGDYGVWVAQTPALSVIDWGTNAFNTNEELVKFLAMHGYSIRPNTDSALYEECQLHSASWPKFPMEGSIADMGDYIIVHF